jgi:hypothetical protein
MRAASRWQCPTSAHRSITMILNASVAASPVGWRHAGDARYACVISAGFSDACVKKALASKLDYTVMGLLRRAGYRSAGQYLHVARQRHVERGGIISSSAALACERADRACRRGRGPAKQAQPLPVGRFKELPAGRAPWCAGGYIHPRRALTVGAWWLHREIELSNIRVKDVRTYVADGCWET